MRCRLIDSLIWVYPDSKVDCDPCLYHEIDVARGGTAAVTILMKEAKPGTQVRLAALSKTGGRAQFFRLIDVPVERNTGPVGFTEQEGERNKFVTRRAPFRVYDAMQPIGTSFKVKTSTEAVLVHIPVAEDTKPGKREYRLSVTHGKETHELKLAVTVSKAVIPPIGRNSWPFTNWFRFGNMATRHRLKPWSEGHWAMICQYARLMAHNRQNTFWFTFGDVFTSGKTGLVLNRERLRRIVKTFTNAGLYYIEGGHFGGRSTSEWTCPTFNVSLTKHLATSVEGNADISSAARQLMAEIETNGWRGRYLQHVTDEPIKENANDYRIFVGMVRKYMPGIPILDALMDPALAGSVNIWCPQCQHYQKDRDRFDAMRTVGDRLWFYTCCFPGGPWLNRLLDMELLRPALLGWGAALFHLDGFLHWGLNMYRENQNPFEMSVIPNWGGGSNSLPAGDTHVVYPGDDGPWSSVRFESQREGIEDLELLRLLEQKHPKQASSLVRSVIRGFDDYTKETTVFRAARRKLLQRLTE
ncbi:MAG: DUF4091 domain-containing protein [Verrucomicrobia bacterium]|nr:DUF4091 domain-containing protein [Verrucomicrobiota bacterium]MBU4246819.1 DUF4091 domain-containing protein [Verrucomicrobiota bacterium]MBU4291813.1 DUF4091 domain-containing protein [Verrucomicrobiota bacterium]MCG2680812.1 DUF4091 domain-containing protein [Kiritimatiellia bacterium]